jgi:hypothetical protein
MMVPDLLSSSILLMNIKFSMARGTIFELTASVLHYVFLNTCPLRLRGKLRLCLSMDSEFETI